MFWWFNPDFHIFNEHYVVDVFVITLRFEIYEGQWQWIFSESMSYVYKVCYFMLFVSQFTDDICCWVLNVVLCFLL
jgi:hypothetical protein